MQKTDVSLEKLLEVGAHFGHQVRRWNPKASAYLYGAQEGVHIFDLVKTREALLEALAAIEAVVKKGGVILLVGTKNQAKEKILKVAKLTDSPYVSERWLGGSLTNFAQMVKSFKKLAEMKKAMAEGEYNTLTKKERLLKAREIAKLEKIFGGISTLEKLPDMLVVVDTKREAGAVREAANLDIPTVGIVDSNDNPEKIDWPIPMNDDATNAIEYVLDLIGEVIKKAKKKA
jgi:small subunit ribosomal protein S2